MSLNIEKPVATVLITTRNRRECLKSAIQSVYSQDVAVELIVSDDGSTDSTSEMVRKEFPNAILTRTDQALGIIGARNRASALATTSILFTLDDDAVFTAPNTVSVVLDCFKHSKVGAVALPYINYLDGQQQGACNVFEWVNYEDFPCVSTFSGGACAFRVDLFRSCGGYSGSGRQHEELSLCHRFLDKGYVVRVANVTPLAHFPTHGAAIRGTVLREAVKNRIAFAWEQVPWPDMPILVCGTAARYVTIGAREGELQATLLGVVEGIRQSFRTPRRAVSRGTYRLHRRLTKRGPLRFSEIERYLAGPSLG